VLAEHGVDNADKGFVAGEQAMPAGEQVSFEPAFALVFAEHRVEDAPGGGEELVVVHGPGFPLAIGDFEDAAEEIGEHFIGTEDAEIPVVLIEADDVAQEAAEDQGILGVDAPRRADIYGVFAEVGHAEVAEKRAAIGMRVGAHSPVARWGQVGEFGQQSALLVEQFFGFIAFHPAF